MQQAYRELREIYRSRVHERLRQARNCLARACVARQDGDSAGVLRWLTNAKVLRTAAARWRKRAEKLAPMLVCLVWCCLSGCAKAPALDVPSREVTANFEVQPSPDGQSIVWSLQFRSREQYHAFLESHSERRRARQGSRADRRRHAAPPHRGMQRPGESRHEVG